MGTTLIQTGYASLSSDLSAVQNGLQEGGRTGGPFKVYPHKYPELGLLGSYVGRIEEKLRAETVAQTVERVIERNFFEVIRHLYQLRSNLFAHHVRVIQDKLQTSLPADVTKLYKTILEDHASISYLNDEAVQLFSRRLQTQLTARELGRIRRAVANFFLATNRFWEYALSEKTEDEESRKPIEANLNAHAVFADRRLLNCLEGMRNVHNLEGILRKPIPFVPLAKVLAQSEKSRMYRLSSQESDDLNGWIEALNQHENEFSCEEFAAILRQIAEILQLACAPQGCYVQLLLLLDTKKCTLLNKVDPQLLNWRFGLKPGDKIADDKGRKYTLGKVLNGERLVRDRYRIFELADDDTKVVMFPPNRFRFVIDRFKQQDPANHWMLIPAEVGIDGYVASGDKIFTEKLSNPLAGRKWTSTKRELDDKERKELDALVGYLIYWKEHNRMPAMLNPKHLMYSREGILKTTRLVGTVTFNYLTVKTFCLEVANGNPPVFNYLMRVSRLNDHPVAKCIQDTVYAKLTIRPDAPRPSGEWDQEVIQRIEEIYQQALKLREDTLEAVGKALNEVGKYRPDQNDNLQETIQAMLALLYLYDSHHPEGLNPDFTETIKTKMVEGSVDPNTFGLAQFLKNGESNGYYNGHHRRIQRLREEYKVHIALPRQLIATQQCEKYRESFYLRFRSIWANSDHFTHLKQTGDFDGS